MISSELNSKSPSTTISSNLKNNDGNDTNTINEEPAEQLDLDQESNAANDTIEKDDSLEDQSKNQNNDNLNLDLESDENKDAPIDDEIETETETETETEIETDLVDENEVES